MRKLFWFFLFVGIISIGILVGYAFVDEWKQPIGNTVAVGRDFIVGQASAFAVWFQTLPYWPAIGIGIGILFGIMLDRWAWKTLISVRQRMVGSAIRESGLSSRQSRPVIQQTTTPPPRPQTPVEDTTVLQTAEPEQT